MDKIFFYDLGIRNAMIDNFKVLEDRNDAGVLWENFLIIERMKFLAYSGVKASCYFWRTHTGAELDYVEEGGGKIGGYEFKFGNKTKKAPEAWVDNYGGEFSLVNRNNFLEFIR
ncbi:MAG: hypothetical protein ACD_7C00232G0001 [uncultured bacterium]|nr:MAG: hypothetical protein ACD_7C00232G0001 [uncultured bacterium]